ncbi:MAG: nucleoside triphosphate pyrophosphohydrolase [Rhodospirillales bacterium]|nr:MAG: nucleoside triphosphate pyrophosphohydrolase [Rhodospirillales bacterium]
MPTDPDPNLSRLLAIMARLRDPERGCPWDIVQTFETIAPYTIEEAYEVADAIARGDLDDLRDELGDLLLQVVYHARMAEERHAFTFADVVAAISNKMVRRHPHVFGDAQVASADEQTRSWEAHKAAERAVARKSDGPRASALDGIAVTLPAMTRAAKLQKRAARIGFDWPDAADVLAKLDEEVAELHAELTPDPPRQRDPERIEDEVGDLLFVCVNLARKLDLDPEQALRRANAKFERRFRHMEAAAAASDAGVEGLPLDALEALWRLAKDAEKRRG